MVDSLLQFLLDEIAFDADSGTSLPALSALITTFYSLSSPSSSSSADPTPSTSANPASARQQRVDDAFLAFVWDALVAQDDVRVGVLEPLEGVADEQEEDNGEGQGKEEGDAAEEGEEDSKPTTGKGSGRGSAKKKKKPAAKKLPRNKGGRDNAPLATHEMRFLPADEIAEGLAALRFRYGDERLRVGVGEETAWAAITGSHAKISALTPTIYSVLKMVARGREDGTTAVRISKELGIEPKSVFHCIKIPTNLGLTKKFPDLDAGSRTNRVLHVRYLSRSPRWAIACASDPTSAEDESGPAPGGSDEEGEEEEGSGGQGEMMTPLSAQYLATNRGLIKTRVLKALRRRGREGWMPHSEIAPSIGLHMSTSLNLRRLNFIITEMANVDRSVVKVFATKRSEKGRESSVQGLRLARVGEFEEEGEEGQGKGKGKATVQLPTPPAHLEPEQDEDDDDDTNFPVLGRSVERQVLELLMNADSRGMTGSEISHSLASLAPRFTDALLQRLSRTPPPPSWADHTLHSVTETVGRLKQTRWFSLAGYLGFRREKGVLDEAEEERFAALLEKVQERAEGWKDEPDAGPWEGQYDSRRDPVGRLRGYGTMQMVGPAVGPKKRAARPVKAKKAAAGGKGKGKGKGKAADQDAPAEEDAEEDDQERDPTPPPPPPKPKKPTGRPRKNPLPPGVTESPYMRRKREKAEDEERERLGLEPIVREKVRVPRARKGTGTGTPRVGARRGVKAEEKEKEAEGEGEKIDVEGEDEHHHPPGPSSAPAPADANNAAAPAPGPGPVPSSSAAAPSSAVATPTAAAKKRGRPPKKQGATPAPVPEPEAEAEEVDQLEEEQPVEEETPRSRRGRTATAAKEKETEVEKDDDLEPASPPKRRGRAAAAKRKSQPEEEPAPVASSSAAAFPATPAASTSTSASPRRTLKRRLEPYVDIEVPVSSPMAKRLRAAEAATAVGSSPPAPSSSPAKKDKGKGKEKEVEVEVEVEVEQEGPAEEATPAPASSSQATPFGTPRIGASLLRENTPSSTKPGGKSKLNRRVSQTSKDNLTLLTRQKELVDWTASVGGVFAREHRTAQWVRDFVKQRGDANAPQMDRHVFAQVLETAVKREALRKTVTTDGNGKRREIFYLPALALDSPAVVDFLANIPQGTQSTPRLSHFKHDPELVLDLDNADGFVGKPKGGRKKQDLAAEAQPAVQPPDPSADVAVVQEFFRNEAGVLGRSNGVRHGIYARARQLHKWLASFIFNQPDDSEHIALRDGDGVVVSQSTLLNSMPLGVYVRVVPIPVESETLTAFLAEKANRDVAMGSLPAEIDRLIKPRLNKRKAAMWKNLDALVRLHLLERLVPADKEQGDAKAAFMKPIRPREVTHWCFFSSVPVYAVRTQTAPLVAVHDLVDNESVAAFWTELQAACDPSNHTQTFEPLAEDARRGFDAVSPAPNVFRKELRGKTRWRDAYQLSELQRVFLVSLVEHDRDVFVNPERAGEVEQYAKAVFAPLDVVKAYVERYVRLGRSKADEGEGARKRRKVVRKKGGADGETHGGDEEGEQPLDKSQQLQRKIKDAAEQRERDWTGIVSRFRTDHGNPELDDSIVDYLHRRFVDPRRQIDARQLDFELRRLLPPPGEGVPLVGPPPPALQPGEEPLKSTVPLVLIRKARLAKDPYAISRQPNIRKRTRQVQSKNVQRKGAAAVGSHKEPAKPFTTGDQAEFLDVPLPARPTQEKGSRLPRNFYSPEQDDLLLDAFAVLKARAERLKMRIAYGALEHLFKGHEGRHLGVRAKKLIAKEEDRQYHIRLVTEWAKTYELKKGELEDPNPGSMTDFDIAACVRCLRVNVDKRVLRLMRTLPEQQPAPVSLPSSLAELDEDFTLTPTDAATTPAKRWDPVWSRFHIASNVRDDAASAAPFAKAQYEEAVKPMLKTREAEKAAAALKMVLTTPEAKYVEAQGTEMLQPFMAQLDDVVKVLTDKHIIVRAHAESDRRLPGRNFSYNDRFFDRFDNRVDLGRLASAADFEKEMHGEGFDGTFPLIPADGEMMAFLDLVSEGKVELSIDTSVLGDKALRIDDYMTRQANDDDIECTIGIEPVQAQEERSAALPDVHLPEKLTDEAAALETARTKLEMLDDRDVSALAVEIEQQLVTAGEEGVRIQDFSHLATRSTILAAIVALTTPSTGNTPLAFFAGSAALSLVSSSFLSSWTLPLPSSDKEPKERVLPYLWLDLHGEVGLELWNRSAGWVKGELLVRSGTTLPELVEKATTRHLLSAYEVHRVLETLFKAGKVEIRRAGVEGPISYGCGEVLVNWEADGWFVKGEFW